MKVLQVNTVYPNGSTGKIARGIKDMCEQEKIECKVAYRYCEGKEKIEDTYTVSSFLDCHIHNRLSQRTMLQGCFSRLKTYFFLKKVDKFAPDIIHLHNIHGSFINHKMLFKYIKKNHIKVIWTLHDCWSFTGHCPYFDMIGCEKWKDECGNCSQKGGSYIDASSKMQKNKKEWFTGVENMTLVTPSNWLADLVKQSFLKDYSVKVINNGIDLSIFKPTDSNFREKYNIQDKFILLGVAFGWGKRKGLDVFIELSKRLDKTFQIVLVGTDERVDKLLPKNIISIHRTQNQTELAQIYSASDLFVNPTREENFPTVNIEALACGTPIVTFKTGGSPEIIDKNCGRVVEKNDLEGLIRAISEIKEQKPYSEEACLKRARNFDMSVKFAEYIDLYKE